MTAAGTGTAYELFLSDGSRASGAGTSPGAAVQRYAAAHPLLEVVAWREADAEVTPEPDAEPEAEAETAWDEPDPWAAEYDVEPEAEL